MSAMEMENQKKPSVLDNAAFLKWLDNLDNRVTMIAMSTGAYLDRDLTVEQLAGLKGTSDTHIRQMMKAIPRYERAFIRSQGLKGNLKTTMRLIRDAEDDISKGIYQ